MCSYNEILKVEKEIKEIIDESSFAGYTLPDYQDTYRMVENIERGYQNEIDSGMAPNIVELRYDIVCFDREFVIEVSERYKDVAYKIIDAAYSKWCDSDDEVADMCCEEYINNCLKYYGIEYTEKDV